MAANGSFPGDRGPESGPPAPAAPARRDRGPGGRRAPGWSSRTGLDELFVKVVLQRSGNRPAAEALRLDFDDLS